MENETDPATIEQHLLPGERVLWTGRPNARPLLSPVDVFLVPFSLMWGGFAIFWELAVLTNTRGASAFLALWGIPFVVIGQYMIWGRFIVRRRQQRLTTYALTDRRALVVTQSAFGNERLQAAFLNQVPAVNLRRRRDGSGSIEFGSVSGFFGMSSMYRDAGMSFMTPGMSGPSHPVFTNIADVASVYRLAMDRQRATDSDHALEQRPD
jgi:hypothetical protein